MITRNNCSYLYSQIVLVKNVTRPFMIFIRKYTMAKVILKHNNLFPLLLAVYTYAGSACSGLKRTLNYCEILFLPRLK